MSESDNDGAREAEFKFLAEKERHEKKLEEVVDRLHSLEYVRDGEWLGYSVEKHPTTQELRIRLETRTLGDQASVDERKKQFPNEADLVTTLLQEAGYSLDVDYDSDKSDAQIDHLIYNLHEKEKK